MKSVVAFLDDLFFQVKIADGAKRAGLAISFVKTEEGVLQRIGETPSILVVDLNCALTDPIALASRVKTEFPSTPVIGFVSHVQTDVRERARLAGCDAVLARSVFSSKLPDVLQEFAL